MHDDLTERFGGGPVAEWFAGASVSAARIAVVLVVAWLVSRLLRRRLASAVAAFASGTRAVGLGRGDAPDPRAEGRRRTVNGLLASSAAAVIWAIAIIVCLDELGVEVGPLVAGAGVAGVALGFGAQSLVRDLLSGLMMIVEDQLGVGDAVDVGEVVGRVERVGLRTTVVRDIQGTVWYVPNGVITRVANMSQQWSRALVDVPVTATTDLESASAVLLQVGHGLSTDPQWADRLDGEVEVLGVEALRADAITIRVAARTVPEARFDVERELRRRIKDAFDAAGIDIPSVGLRWPVE